MSKKQVKVSISDINKYINSGTLLNFILRNSSVTLATPVGLNSDNLKVKNTRGQKMDLPLSQIIDIWAEEKVKT